MGLRRKNVTARQRREVLQLSGRPATEVARAVALSRSTVYKIWREANKASQADRELGPHGRELLYFGQRFRDLVSVPSAHDVVKTATEEYGGAMWLGWPNGAVDLGTGYVPRPVPPPDPEEKGMAKEWAVSLRYDARKHSLYPAFRQHLPSHGCWKCLDNTEAAFNKYVGSCRATYEAILGQVRDRLPGVSGDYVEVLAKPLLQDGFSRKKGGPGINFSYDVHEAKQGGLPPWELKLGDGYILADDPAELRTLADVHQQLRASPPYDAELTALAQAEHKASEAAAAFRASLTPDALLRKLVLNGRCEWCP